MQEKPSDNYEGRELSYHPFRAQFIRLRKLFIAIAILCVVALIVVAFVFSNWIIGVCAVIPVILLALTLLIYSRQVFKKELALEIEYLQSLLDNAQDKDEYLFYDMDTNTPILVNAKGITLGDKLYNFEQVDVLVASTNVLNRASFAIFLEPTQSPFVEMEDKFSYGLVFSEDVIGCCKKYFFPYDENESFSFIKRNPALVVKQVLKYGIAEPEDLE